MPPSISESSEDTNSRFEAVLWISGSGEHRPFSEGPLVAWRKLENGRDTGTWMRVYPKDEGFTFNRAVLSRILETVRDLPSGARFRLVCSVSFIVEAFQGELARWASLGFRKVPAKNRDLWQELWHQLDSRAIVVTAERPEAGSKEDAVLGRLQSGASFIRKGGERKSRQRTRVPTMSDILRKHAESKDPN